VVAAEKAAAAFFGDDFGQCVNLGSSAKVFVRLCTGNIGKNFPRGNEYKITNIKSKLK
jgi:hypothetical protein